MAGATDFAKRVLQVRRSNDVLVAVKKVYKQVYLIRDGVVEDLNVDRIVLLTVVYKLQREGSAPPRRSEVSFRHQRPAHPRAVFPV